MREAQQTAGKAKLQGVYNVKKSALFSLGILTVLLTLGMVLGGCSTTGPQKVSWSDYSVHSSKDYTVIGTIVIRTSDARTINADLVEKAVELGGHDIINVRVDVETETQGGERILAATAVVIKYTDETLKTTTTTTVTTNGVATTTTSESPVTAGSGSSTQPGAETSQRKKIFGIF
jgi:hypothetical protein